MREMVMPSSLYTTFGVNQRLIGVYFINANLHKLIFRAGQNQLCLCIDLLNRNEEKRICD